jgi:hypothetical protein
MTEEQILKLARKAKFHSAMMLQMYANNYMSLTDSEINEIESIKKFAKMVEELVLAEAEMTKPKKEMK